MTVILLVLKFKCPLSDLQFIKYLCVKFSKKYLYMSSNIIELCFANNDCSNHKITILIP